jgi:IS4 transposase
MGVVADMRVKTRAGHPLRLICYLDPVTGRTFEFLTNEPDLPLGVLVELYRRRWDVEKVFDALKNKLGETKAWATSLGFCATQVQFLMLAHNLQLLYEQELE